MYIQNRLASLIYKLAIVLMCLVGIVLNSGLTTGTFAPYVLLYYTMMSNIFCLIFFAVSAIVTAINIKNSGQYGVIRFAPHFKGAVVMGMLLCSIIYIFILADSPASVFTTIANVIAHLVVPLMVLLDWVLFDHKGRFTGSDPLIWMVIPFTYYAIVLLAAQFGVTYYGGVHYPYRFIDPDLIRWSPVLVNIFLVCLGYVAVGYILMGVDRALGNHAKKKALQNAAYMAEQSAPATATPTGAQPAEAPPEEIRTLQDILNQSAAPASVAAAPAQPVPPIQPAAPVQPPPAGTP